MPKIRLQKRERAVVTFGVVAVAAIIGYQLCQAPLREYRKSAELVAQARRNLASVEQWAEQVHAARGEQESLSSLVKARGSFDLFSYLNRTLDAAGLRDRADLQSRGTRGRIDEAQLTLNGVSMKEIVDLFYSIESSKNLVALLKLDHLRAARDGQGLDARMTLVSPK